MECALKLKMRLLCRCADGMLRFLFSCFCQRLLQSCVCVQCMSAYPSCDTVSAAQPTPACTAACLQVKADCKGLDTTIVTDSGLVNLNCSSYPSSPPQCFAPSPLFTPTLKLPSCQAYNGVFARVICLRWCAAGSVCSSIVDYSVYVPAGYTQQHLESVCPLDRLLFSLCFLCSWRKRPCLPSTLRLKAADSGC